MPILHSKHGQYAEQIVIREFSEVIGLQENIASWKQLLSSNLINEKTVGVIHNLSNGKLKMDSHDLDELIFFLKNEPIIRKLKQAVISQSPSDIVLPMLAKHREQTLLIEPFSTMDAATRWIIHGY
ncbi:MAG: hypothetical protein H6537_12200 [Bacteroidales bacterium]|nr:hypothetical protein [Bacteroidales bacterium]HPD95400.1 hypothetical protein [Tenuifilaceae bacterium]